MPVSISVMKNIIQPDFYHNGEYERILKHKTGNEVIKNLISTFAHISIFLLPSNNSFIVETPG
jgi:hypothetical protein